MNSTPDETYLAEVTNASYCNLKCIDQKNCGGLYYISIYLAQGSTPKDVGFLLVLVSST
jgi:hypothetical protein